jgi:hypothetical protein
MLLFSSKSSSPCWQEHPASEIKVRLTPTRGRA